MIHRLVNYSISISCLVLSYIAKTIKFSFILGSQAAFFSLSNCVNPLVGYYGGAFMSSLVYVIQIVAMGLFKGVGLYISSLYHIPTLFGSLYVSTQYKAVRLGIPFVCMALFIVHPIGAQAYWYSFYWFIPMVIALVSCKHFFVQALGCTFTMHAVGSVIWLYSRALDAHMWQTLTSVVWAERLLLALGMTVVYYAFEYIKAYAVAYIQNYKGSTSV